LEPYLLLLDFQKPRSISTDSQAAIRPSALTPSRCGQAANAVQISIVRALAHRRAGRYGSTLRDFLNTSGQPGYFQQHRGYIDTAANRVAAAVRLSSRFGKASVPIFIAGVTRSKMKKRSSSLGETRGITPPYPYLNSRL
jgi:hypothetical protein